MRGSPEIPVSAAALACSVGISRSACHVTVAQDYHDVTEERIGSRRI